MSERRLVLRIYRSILRWARANAAVPFTLRAGDVLSLAPELPRDVLDGGPAVACLARQAFKHAKQLKDEAAEQGLDRGLGALRLLHDDYGASIANMRATRADRADRAGVVHPLGTVFVHGALGYRGVVFGWDRQCERGEDWAREAGVDPRQPFYHVLPDETDCVRLFGGVRSSKYVAQANVAPLRAARVTHRALASFFDAYDYESGRYVPNPALRFQYPDDSYAVGITPRTGPETEQVDVPDPAPGSGDDRGHRPTQIAQPHDE